MTPRTRHVLVLLKTLNYGKFEQNGIIYRFCISKGYVKLFSLTEI